MHRIAVMGPPLPADERALRLSRIYPGRYGVLMRECLEREGAEADWPALYAQLQRLEMRGEVRRGYFVAGMSGLQFALPEAVEKLRASAEAADEGVTVINAVDPINLFGGEMSDGPVTAAGEPLRFARLPSTHVALWRGRPVLVAEDGGDRITTLQGAELTVVQRALQAYLTRPHAPRHLLVTTWDGRPVDGSAGRALLQALGFYRVPAGMEWWSQV